MHADVLCVMFYQILSGYITLHDITLWCFTLLYDFLHRMKVYDITLYYMVFIVYYIAFSPYHIEYDSVLYIHTFPQMFVHTLSYLLYIHTCRHAVHIHTYVHAYMRAYPTLKGPLAATSRDSKATGTPSRDTTRPGGTQWLPFLWLRAYSDCGRFILPWCYMTYGCTQDLLCSAVPCFSTACRAFRFRLHGTWCMLGLSSLLWRDGTWIFPAFAAAGLALNTWSLNSN